MKIVLTGADGFLGANLLKRLRSEHEVFAISRRSCSDDALSAVNWIRQDLTASIDYSQLPHRADAIIHLAQSKYYKEFPEQAQDIFDVNTRSTLQLLEYGRRAGIERFIYASTGGVYGFGKKEFVETDPNAPTNFYLMSKCWGEALITEFGNFFGTIVLRPFFIYGQGQKQSMLIPRLVRSVFDETEITLDGAEGIRINPLYVVDAVRAIASALRVDGHQIINIAGAEVLSIGQIARDIGKELCRKPVFKIVADRQPADLVGDIQKMKKLLGAPETPFREGLALVCHEFRASLNSHVPNLSA